MTLLDRSVFGLLRSTGSVPSASARLCQTGALRVSLREQERDPRQRLLQRHLNGVRELTVGGRWLTGQQDF